MDRRAYRFGRALLLPRDARSIPINRGHARGDASARALVGSGVPMEGKAETMYLLQYGQEPVPKRISVRGAGEELLWEPIIGIVIKTTIGWVLLETGIGRPVLDDAQALKVLYPGEHKPWGLDGDPLTAALAGVGLSASDIRLAAV